MIISFDNATKKTGYAIFDDDNKLIEYSYIKSDSLLDIQRILDMVYMIKNIISKHKEATIIIENPMYFRFNINTFKQLNMLYGIIIYNLDNMKLSWKSYTPNSWRKIFGFSKGKHTKLEKKQMAINFVNNTFNINIDDNDIAEAICIGYAYLIEEGLIKTNDRVE